jgi:hypothetical protein
MPLLSPQQLNPILEAAGFLKDDKDLKSILDKNGMSKGEIVEEIANIMRGGESGHLKLRAAELGAKMQKMLTDDSSVSLPSITIVIKDSAFSEINPILIPRESV